MKLLVLGLALGILVAYGQHTSVRTTVPLVALPVSVTDRAGHPIDGLTESDFVVLDNGRPRAIHLDTTDDQLAPISLVIAVQSSDISGAALAKIQNVGSLIGEAVVGANGEVAVVTFNQQIQVVKDFTRDSSAVSDAFSDLKPSDNTGGRMMDAVEKALDLLAARPGPRRSNILIISETRDRGSESKLSDLPNRAQQAAVTIHSISYSAYATAFTTKPEDYSPPNGGAANFLAIFTETARMAKKNTVQVLTQATGGRRMSFQTQSRLENDLISLGNEIHNEYLVTFTPDQGEKPSFHQLVVEVTGHADAIVRTRPGYWAIK